MCFSKALHHAIAGVETHHCRSLRPESQASMSQDPKPIYSDDWDEISLACREKANWQCEQCNIAEGTWRLGKTFSRPYRISLQVAHLNHDTMDNREENLRVLCQACHLKYDGPQHGKHGKATKHRKKRERKLAAVQLYM